MDANQSLREALRRIGTKAAACATDVRASDLRRALADIAKASEEALAPHEPTPLEMRAALEQIARGEANAAALAREVLR